jgi:hypothetical protein
MPENKSSDPPPSKGKHFVDQLNAYRNIILAVTALATAVGSWLKPTDTTATEQSFDWTTQRVEELAKTDVQLHDDIEAIRAYLQASHEAALAEAQAATAAAAAAPPRPARPTSGGRRQRHDQDMGEGAQMDMPPEGYAEAQHEAPPAPVEYMLPNLRSSPQQFQRPTFDDVIQEEKGTAEEGAVE